MDEDQIQQNPTPAQNEPATPNEPAAPAPPAEETEQPQEAAEPEQQTEEAEAPAEPTEKPKQSRAERRIRQLNEKVKQAQYDQSGPQQQSPQFPTYQDGESVSPERLQQDVVQTADAIANIRVQQQLGQFQARSDFDRDMQALPQQYEELKPDSPTYTPELDESIAQEFQDRAFKVVGYNPQTGQPITQLDQSVRLSDIAERQIKAARAYAAKTSATMRNAIDATADSTAPRPGGDKPANKEFKDLSIEEMEQQLGYVRR